MNEPTPITIENKSFTWAPDGKQETPPVTTTMIDGNPTMTKEQNDALLAQINVAKVYEEMKPKTDAAIIESMANERAAREPLPGVTEFAFTNEPLTVKTSIGKVTIRPMVSYDINIFKLINSPFYQIIMGDKEESKDGLFADAEESYELIYQFTTPVKEVYKAYKKGKDTFRDIVMEEVAFKYNPADASLLVNEIMKHIFHVNLTRVQFDAPAEPVADSAVSKNPMVQELKKNQPPNTNTLSN